MNYDNNNDTNTDKDNNNDVLCDMCSKPFTKAGLKIHRSRVHEIRSPRYCYSRKGKDKKQHQSQLEGHQQIPQKSPLQQHQRIQAQGQKQCQEGQLPDQEQHWSQLSEEQLQMRQRPQEQYMMQHQSQLKFKLQPQRLLTQQDDDVIYIECKKAVKLENTQIPLFLQTSDEQMSTSSILTDATSMPSSSSLRSQQQPEEVAKWVNFVTNSTSNGESFVEQEIDGNCLLMLKNKELEKLKLKMGPTIMLKKALNELKAREKEQGICGKEMVVK